MAQLYNIENKSIRLNELLQEVKNITDKYRGDSEKRGDNFNVFNILRAESDEVRTHTRLLGELLNPKGSHFMGTVFLKEFLKELDVSDFDEESTQVEIEKFIGPINETYDEGGSIDIILSDKKRNAIIIENKIYAIDQPKQLERYKNYGIRNFRRVILVYLTLDGRQPTEAFDESIVFLTNKCLSYGVNIKRWLENCRIETENKPNIYWVLNQYLNIINQLTGQTLNNKMTEEIIKMIIGKEENLRTFFELRKPEIMNGIQNHCLLLLKEQLESIANELNLKLEFPVEFGFNKDAEFGFLVPYSVHGYGLFFGFNEGLFRGFVYGVYSKDQPYKESHKVKCAEIYGFESIKPSNWLFLKQIEDDKLQDWTSANSWLAILDGNLMKDTVFKRTTEMLELVKSFDGDMMDNF